EISSAARDHAWDWFALHASQRMQTFNFFLVVTAFLIAAYGSLLEKHRAAALVVAVAGAWFAVWFNRLDYRTRQLIQAGENALGASEARLREKVGVSELEIVRIVAKPSRGASTYRRVIGVIEWTIFWIFLGGAGYAVWLLSNAPLPLLD